MDDNALNLDTVEGFMTVALFEYRVETGVDMEPLIGGLERRLDTGGS